jgi:hypothetical protein
VKYEDMARGLGVPLCTECTSEITGWDAQEILKAHRKGFTDRGVVHWKRERTTDRGTYEFLKLCWQTQPEATVRGAFPYWLWLYKSSTWAAHTAREFGTVIPFSVTRYDRLHVRSALPDRHPSDTPEYRWAHREAS